MGKFEPRTSVLRLETPHIIILRIKTNTLEKNLDFGQMRVDF